MLNEIRTPLEKLIWLWLHGKGQSTPNQMSKEIGIPRRSIMRGLAELTVGGFVIRAEVGLYCVTSGTPSAASGTPGRGCATSDTPHCAMDGTNCATGGTQNAQINILKGYEIEIKGNEIKGNLIPISEIWLRVDRDSSNYQTARQRFQEMFQERDISADLIDRIAAGYVLQLAGFHESVLYTVKREAEEQQRAGKLKARWIHVAKFVQQAYEAAGFAWSPCRTQREIYLTLRNEIRRKEAAASANRSAAIADSQEPATAVNREVQPPPQVPAPEPIYDGKCRRIREVSHCEHEPKTEPMQKALQKLGAEMRRFETAEETVPPPPKNRRGRPRKTA